MRTIIYSLILLVLGVMAWQTPTTALAQTAKTTKKAPPKKEYAYKIQIAAYREYSFAQQITGLDSIGNVFMEKGDNDIYRVVMGYYNNLADAKAALALVEQAGYPDAYVASQEAKTEHGVLLSDFFAAAQPEAFFAATEPIPVAPAVTPTTKPPTPPDPTASEQIVADKKTPAKTETASEMLMTDKKTPVKTETEPAKETPMANKPATFDTKEAEGSGEQYVIDLGTLDDVANKKLGALRDMEEDIYTSQRNHVILGPYSDLSQASKSLTTVVKKGFDNATIIMETDVPNNAVKNKMPTPKPSTFKDEPKTETPKAATQQKVETQAKPAAPTPKPAPSAEAEFKPMKVTPPAPAKTTTTETAKKPTTFSETSATTTTTGSITATMPTPSPQELSAFVTFDAVFEEVEFDMFKVDSYDPTHETITAGTSAPIEEVERNKQLKGTKLSNSLVQTLLPAESTDKVWSFYGLYKFNIDEQNIGYIVRSGKGEYQNDNNIDLYVYNNNTHQFVSKESLSKIYSNKTMLGVVQSWLLDLNNDGFLDILSYNLEEQNAVEQGYQIRSKFNGKIWMKGSYKKAQLMNEDKLRQQLNLQ